MNQSSIRYDRASASRLLPLLSAIGRELRERETRIRVIENELAYLEASPLDIDETATERSSRVHLLVSDATKQNREVRAASKELDALGCTIVGNSPLTIRIPGQVGESKHSFVWQTGDAVLS